MWLGASSPKGEVEITRGNKPDTLGSISLGAKFIYRTVRKPPFEGEVLTVVGFEARYKNNVVVEEPDGSHALLPLQEVEKALSLLPAQGSPTKDAKPMNLEEALEFVRRTDRPEWNALIREIKETQKGRDINSAARLNAGDRITFDAPESGQSVQGYITKINAGRVTVDVRSGPIGFPKCLSMPASMVKRCSQQEK
jgi:hypothetical protein